MSTEITDVIIYQDKPSHINYSGDTAIVTVKVTVRKDTVPPSVWSKYQEFFLYKEKQNEEERYDEEINNF